jgi:hypothetical protein
VLVGALVGRLKSLYLGQASTRDPRDSRAPRPATPARLPLSVLPEKDSIISSNVEVDALKAPSPELSPLETEKDMSISLPRVRQDTPSRISNINRRRVSSRATPGIAQVASGPGTHPNSGRGDYTVPLRN